MLRKDVRTRLIEQVGIPQLEAVAPLASGRLIDIGCGTKPWQSLFAPYVRDHVGVDHEGTRHDITFADHVGTAYDLPVPDASFDTVLCTAVLEHLEEPQRALHEARRVLRDGGVAIYTIPHIWHLHEEPRDFFRYTKYGIRHLFENAGFDLEVVQPLAGFWVTWATMLSYHLHDRPRGRVVRRLRLVHLAILGVQAVAGRLDRRHRDERFTWMYLVVARARTRA